MIFLVFDWTSERSFTILIAMTRSATDSQINSAIAQLHRFHRRHRRMPSFRELAELMGWRSKNAAARLVKKLKTKQVLTQDPHSGQLLPGPGFGWLKVLGSVEAGFPGAAEEEFLDTLTLDEWLLENREASFALQVTGYSMAEAGILPGDTVLVERGKEAGIGDIVIAEIDGQWTIKYLRQKNGSKYLEPANKKYPPLYPQTELMIAAVVVGVVRKYH